MTNPRKDLSDIQAALLNIVDQMSDTLSRVPPRMEKITENLTKLNKQLKDFNALVVMNGGKADVTYLKKVADQINNNLSPYIQENKNIQDALKGLNQLKADIEEKTRTFKR